MPRARTGIPLLAMLWFTFALNYIDRQMVYSMFPALRAELGFSGATLGLIGSIFLWVYTLSMPLAGKLADLWRKDTMIVLSLVLWSAATLGGGLAGSQIDFLAWRGVMGLTEAFYYPASLALIAAHFPGAQRSKALGWHQSAQLIGVIAGGWYGGWAADHVGWRTAFYVAAAAGGAYSLLLYAGIHGSDAKAPASTKQRGRLADLFQSRCYLALCGAFTAFCAMQWIFFAWFPTFLQERFGLSMTDSGWNATLFVQSSTIVGILTGGALADRLTIRWPAARFYVAAAGVAASAPFAYLTFAADSLNYARLWSAGFGLFAGLLAANAFAAAYDVVAVHNRGLGGGFLNMTGGISSATMIYVAGILKDTIGFSGLLVWMASAAVAAASLVLWVSARSFPAEALPQPHHVSPGAK